MTNLVITGTADEKYVRPAGLSLLFCSKAQIAAAPQAEREAYYRIVEGICENPEAFGLEPDNDYGRRHGRRLSDNEIDDNQYSLENGDGEIY